MRRHDPVVCFVSASGQNVFFDEMLDAMRAGLEGDGVATRTAVDHFPPLEEDLVYLVVPHEYFALTLASAHPDEHQLKRTIALETEQPGTHWFEHAAGIAARCAVTVDINHLGVAALRARGIDARYLRFGYVPEWDHWGGDATTDRPIDVTFMGGHTPRRGAALGRMAPFLAGRRASLHLLETVVPHTENSVHFIAGARKWDQLARSKVIVNVHRDALGYFEWLRVVGAIGNGCVVVTEHSIGCRPLVPGRHFVSASYAALPHVVEALLRDEELLGRIRDEAYRTLRTDVRLADSIGVIRDAAVDVLDAAPPLPRFSRRARPAPKPPEYPPIEYFRLADERDEISLLRTGVKHLLLEQRELRRQLARVDTGDGRPEITARTSGRYRQAHPRVSVLVSVYNYENAVREAISSVATSTFRDFELVIVDDGSRDGSVAAVEQVLDACPWVPALHLVRRRNAGLAAARNLAVERARGDLVFILDADNAVYPHALERLVGALDRNRDANFAYGILEKSAPRSGDAVDLMSWGAWDPLRLRFGNYIDAMALLRRDAVLAVGGYTTDYRLHGWEDFALWCAFAHTGRRGVHVPEILARYVSAVHSMITVTNIDASEAYAALAARFPFMAGEALSSERGSSGAEAVP